MPFFGLLDSGSVTEDVLELREKGRRMVRTTSLGVISPHAAPWPVQCMTPRKAVQGPTASRYW